MINSEEMVFAVDAHNQQIKPQRRSDAHKDGIFHRTSGIWVVNSKKQILCQKRSLKKDVKPGFWEAFFGGHLAPDEEYLYNAAYEAGEELGIKVKESDLIPYKVFKSDKPSHREFQHVFILKLNKEAHEFDFEEDEIDQLEWKSIEELMEILVVKKDPHWVHKPWDKEVLTFLRTCDSD